MATALKRGDTFSFKQKEEAYLIKIPDGSIVCEGYDVGAHKSHYCYLQVTEERIVINPKDLFRVAYTRITPNRTKVMIVVATNVTTGQTINFYRNIANYTGKHHWYVPEYEYRY